MHNIYIVLDVAEVESDEVVMKMAEDNLELQLVKVRNSNHLVLAGSYQDWD